MKILPGYRVRLHHWQVNGLVFSIDEPGECPIKVLIEDNIGGFVNCREDQVSLLPGGYQIGNELFEKEVLRRCREANAEYYREELFGKMRDGKHL